MVQEGGGGPPGPRPGERGPKPEPALRRARAAQEPRPLPCTPLLSAAAPLRWAVRAGIHPPGEAERSSQPNARLHARPEREIFPAARTRAGPASSQRGCGDPTWIRGEEIPRCGLEATVRFELELEMQRLCSRFNTFTKPQIDDCSTFASKLLHTVMAHFPVWTFCSEENPSGANKVFPQCWDGAVTHCHPHSLVLCDHPCAQRVRKTKHCFSIKRERSHPIPGILLEEVQMTSSQKTLSAADIQLQEPCSSVNHNQGGQRIAWRILKCHETPAPHNGPISHHGEGATSVHSPAECTQT
ncbi:uncharacterized protein LOC122183036 [Lagopus leucura]|uniref:uncharacterized protein LOC122183036 n=1 Tax=Lagopus leucura TaxID=30410 RepID=UPI001C670795|nr:uncharacterized protein LOC122183036 [Lagopus leucura]